MKILKHLLLSFLMSLFVATAAQATDIVVSSFQIPNYQWSGATGKLRLYANVSWTDSSGVPHIAGQAGSATGFFQEVSFTVSNRVATVATFVTQSTVDAVDYPQVLLTGVLFDSRGIAHETLFSSWAIPKSPTTTTWLNLVVANRSRPRPLADTYATTPQVSTMIEAAIGSGAPLMTDAIKGKGRLSVPAITGTDPVVKSDNDPLVLDAKSYFGPDPLAAAISAIATTPAQLNVSTTLEILANISIPSTISLKVVKGGKITGAHTITIAGAFEAGVYQVFDSATTVSFAGNSSLALAYPHWWGATGNGVSDDTAAFRAACTSGATTIYTPQGTYMVDPTYPTQGIYPVSNQTLIFAGGATLKAINKSIGASFNSPLILQDVSNVSIIGLHLEGDPGNSPRGAGPAFVEQAYGIVVSGGTDNLVQDCEAFNFNSDGMLIQKSSTKSTRTKVVNFHGHHNGRQGLSVTNADYTQILGGNFEHNLNCGLDLEPDAGLTSDGARIIGVQANFNNYGINVNGTEGVLIDDVDVVGNDLGGVGISSVSAGSGRAKGAILSNSRIKGNLAEAGVKIWAEDVRVHHNVITGNTGIGIMFVTSWAGGSEADHNHIESNTTDGIFIGSANPGIKVDHNWIESSGQHGVNNTSSNVSLALNTIKGNTAHGLFINTTISHVIASGNLIYENGKNGLYAVTEVTDSEFTNNQIWSNSQETSLTYDNLVIYDRSNTNLVQGNIIRKGSLTNKPRYGIRINDSTATNNRIWNNDITDGGATAALSDLGTTTSKRDNQFTTGISQGTATLVAGTVDVTTTEATTGDAVLYSVKTIGGTPGTLSYTITNGTKITFNSSSALDTSTINWFIRH